MPLEGQDKKDYMKNYRQRRKEAGNPVEQDTFKEDVEWAKSWDDESHGSRYKSEVLAMSELALIFHGARKEAADEEDEGKKKAAGVVAITGEPLKGMRAESEIQAIAALCKMAGQPEKAAEFLMQKNPKGQYLSVAEVSEALTSSRVAESESRMISSNVNPHAGAGGIQEVEAQAVAFARQNRGQVSTGLYVTGSDTKITKERSYALMLEEHPEAYAAFRSQHNAKALVATLEAAGIRLAR